MLHPITPVMSLYVTEEQTKGYRQLPRIEEVGLKDVPE